MGSLFFFAARNSQSTVHSPQSKVNQLVTENRLPTALSHCSLGAGGRLLLATVAFFNIRSFNVGCGAGGRL